MGNFRKETGVETPSFPRTFKWHLLPQTELGMRVECTALLSAQPLAQLVSAVPHPTKRIKGWLSWGREREMLELSKMQGCMAGSGVPLGLLLLICLHLPGMEVVPNPLHRWKLEGSRGTGIEGRGKGKRVPWVLGENEGIWNKENPRWALEPNIQSFCGLLFLFPQASLAETLVHWRRK